MSLRYVQTSVCYCLILKYMTAGENIRVCAVRQTAELGDGEEVECSGGEREEDVGVGGRRSPVQVKLRLVG